MKKPTSRRLLVGLGNVDPTLAATRHNAGRRVTGALAYLLRPTRLADTAGCALFHVVHGNTEWYIAEPLCAMNESGRPVAALLRTLKLKPSELIVALDDINLPEGAARYRLDGSDGGHRGLASVLRAVASEQVARLRIGVGRPPRHIEMGDWVLSTPTPASSDAIDATVLAAAQRLLTEH
jgi:PTH1 family peptidyl-tRNA hydrolase